MLGFVVYSPARTGSSAISKVLKSCYQSSTVYQTHNPLFLPETPEKHVAIISKRSDLFQTMISKLTLNHTKEFSGYDPSLKVDSFEIKKDAFEGLYHFMKTFYYLIDTSKFADFNEVLFENFISDPESILTFPGRQGNVPILKNKSPYNYSELILNMDQCKKWFAEFEKTALDPVIIDYVKRDILSTTDLHKWTGITK